MSTPHRPPSRADQHAAQRFCADPAQLRAAWASRRRADWPATFEATMADPLLARLVMLEAGLASGLIPIHPARRRGIARAPEPARGYAARPSQRQQPLDLDDPAT